MEKINGAIVRINYYNKDNIISSNYWDNVKENNNAKKAFATVDVYLKKRYDLIPNIASEARDKLKKVRPETISQASRISGVNPSDISILLVYLESRKNNG